MASFKLPAGELAFMYFPENYRCQIDNLSIGTAYVWDWLEDVLQPGR